MPLCSCGDRAGSALVAGAVSSNAPADGTWKRRSTCDAALTETTGIHGKTLHPMFGPKGSPKVANLLNIIACLQEHERVLLQVVA